MEETNEPPVLPATTDRTPPERNGRRKAYTKEEKLELSIQVRAYRLQGLPFREIGKQLSIPYQRAWQIYKESSIEFVKTHLKEETSLLADFYSRFEFTWRVHYSKYIESIPKDTDGKPKSGVFGDISHLRDACKLQFEAFDRLQSAGFLPKVKERIEHSGIPSKPIKFEIIVDDEEKAKRLKDAMEANRPPA